MAHWHTRHSFLLCACVRVWKMWTMCYLAGGGVALPAGQGLADQVAVLHHQHGVAAAGGVTHRRGPLRGRGRGRGAGERGVGQDGEDAAPSAGAGQEGEGRERGGRTGWGLHCACAGASTREVVTLWRGSASRKRRWG